MDKKTWLRLSVTATVLATLIALPALKPVAAQDGDDAPGWGYGYGMGPGMMGGYGPGYGMMGGGYGGYGMGPGMMGGGYGMGPGMMWGGGYNGFGMGPGMMGYGAYNGLNLSDDQRKKVNKILDDERRGHWAVMGKMMDEQSRMRDLYAQETPDPKKVGAIYAEMAKFRQQMIETHVAAQNQIDQLLTKEQREQVQQWRRGGWGPRGGYGPGMMGPGYGPAPGTTPKP